MTTCVEGSGVSEGRDVEGVGRRRWGEKGGAEPARADAPSPSARTRISLLPNIRSNAFLNEVSAAFPISTASASATPDSHAPATPDASP